MEKRMLEARADSQEAKANESKAPPSSKAHLTKRPAREHSELLEHLLQQQDTERGIQPEPGKLEEDGVAVEPETPPQSPARLPL